VDIEQYEWELFHDILPQRLPFGGVMVPTATTPSQILQGGGGGGGGGGEGWEEQPASSSSSPPPPVGVIDVLPLQIAFELHHEMGRGHPFHLTGEVALLWNRIYEAGYRVISREDNVWGNCCAEFTVVRTVC